MTDLRPPTVIAGGDVVLANGLAGRAGIVIRGERIDAVLGPGEALPGDAEVIDAEGLTVLPGFIDIHCHGGGGEGFDTPSSEGIESILATHGRAGTTAMVAALPAMAPEQRCQALQALRGHIAGRPGRPELLGVYIEGPYYSAAERGAQPEDLIRPPTPEDYGPTLDEFGDLIKVWSLAPELPGATEFIRELSRRGIVPALGHSDAGHEDILAAIDAGARLVTHVYCAHSTFHRDVAEKKLGLGEMALLRDELTVEIIPDGKHLPPLLLQLVLKNKRPGQACVITDAMPAAGLPPGSYGFLSSEIQVTHDVAYRPDGLRYAGSVLTMGRALQNLQSHGGVNMNDATKMISVTPAVMLGVADRKGTIEAGKDADLVLLDEHLQVQSVFCRGRQVDSDGNETSG